MEEIFSHVLFMLSKKGKCSRYESGGFGGLMISSAPHYLHKSFMQKTMSEIGVIGKIT